MASGSIVGFDLASAARAPTRAEALKSGLLIDTSSAAAFLGFTVPAAMTSGVWDLAVGDGALVPSRAEVGRQIHRLQQVWILAREQVGLCKKAGISPRRILIDCPSASGRGSVRLALVCRREQSVLALTLFLEGEITNV